MKEKLKLQGPMNVCVFCGSVVGDREAYRDAARILGSELAKSGFGLVYGGGHIGLMGVIADAALAAGGAVLGVIPRALEGRELAHRGLTRLEVVETMHERKAMMVRESRAFVALPGGFGTLDEFFEVLTWAQLGLHPHPCVLVNIDGYFDPLIAFLDASVREGFVKSENRLLVHVVNCAEDVVPKILTLWNKPEWTPSAGLIPLP